MKNRIKEARKYAQSFNPDFTNAESTVLFFERVEAFLAGVESATPIIEPTNIIFEAIEKAIGVSKDEITSLGKRRRFCYARVIYSNIRHLEVSEYVVAKEINKHRTTVLYYFKKYEDFFNYVPEFREFVKKIKSELGKLNYQKELQNK